MYHYVDFHADGGQMCIPGRRRFSTLEKALRFQGIMDSEPGHHCKNSVKLFSSEEILDEKGHINLRKNNHPYDLTKE